jgi:hypothetical protein
MSKNAMKKSKKNAEWEAKQRQRMKAKGKEKRCAKVDRKKDARKELLWSMNKEERAAYLRREREEEAAREEGLLRAKERGVGIIIDYSLDQHNKPHESTSLIRQVHPPAPTHIELHTPPHTFTRPSSPPPAPPFRRWPAMQSSKACPAHSTSPSAR